MKTTEWFMFLNTGHLDKILSDLILMTSQMQIHSFIRSKSGCLLRHRGQRFQEDQEVQGVRSLQEYRLCREALEDPVRQTAEIHERHTITSGKLHYLCKLHTLIYLNAIRRNAMLWYTTYAT